MRYILIASKSMPKQLDSITFTKNDELIIFAEKDASLPVSVMVHIQGLPLTFYTVSDVKDEVEIAFMAGIMAAEGSGAISFINGSEKLKKLSISSAKGVVSHHKAKKAAPAKPSSASPAKSKASVIPQALLDARAKYAKKDPAPVSTPEPVVEEKKASTRSNAQIPAKIKKMSEDELRNMFQKNSLNEDFGSIVFMSMTKAKEENIRFMNVLKGELLKIDKLDQDKMDKIFSLIK